MSYQDRTWEMRYRSNDSNIPTDFLIPLLEETVLYKRAVGYFSTSSLLKLTVGLGAMAKNQGRIQIVCSPKLSQEDIEAINCGYKSREKTIMMALDAALTPPIDQFEEKRLNQVATLVAEGLLDFKLAFMETDTGINIYHEKIAIAYDKLGNRIGFTGSMNDSENGLIDNFESIVVFCDWKSQDQKNYIDQTQQDFDALWGDDTAKIKVVEFPKLILDKLLAYQRPDMDYDLDRKQFGPSLRDMVRKSFIRIPEGVELLDYQKQAIQTWQEQNYQGIYDMATGTGKTFTALGSIAYLASELNDCLAVFILCPYIHLVGQWEEDVLAWGAKPIICYSQSPDRQWKTHLIDAFKRFRTLKKPFVCLTTMETYTGNTIQQVMGAITPDMNVLLIADEAHNLGTERMASFLHPQVPYRLALSATVERFRDRAGTNRITHYFHEKCIEYPLRKAISDGKSLCPYEYHVIYSFLSRDELDRYNQITEELRRYLVFENGKPKLSKAAETKLFERKRVLAGARDKVDLLRDAMEPYKDQCYILVYCGATSVYDEETEVYEKQIQQIDKMLELDLSMDVHKFTAEESPEQRLTIKECFARGMYQVLTAIKCLDEGINIPNIRTAFILSSSQNPKEFIQRRGRLLRKAPGKERAVIYDFVTLPRPFGSIHLGDFETDRSIVIGEMLRVEEFASDAINVAEGLAVIDEIQQAYGVSVDLAKEKEMQREDYDGEGM